MHIPISSLSKDYSRSMRTNASDCQYLSDIGEREMTKGMRTYLRARIFRLDVKNKTKKEIRQRIETAAECIQIYFYTRHAN